MRVDFYLTTALEVSHYLPIAKALREHDVDVAFISVQTGAPSIGWDHHKVIESLVPSLKVPRFNAEVAVTIQSAKFLRLYRGKKVRFCYGVGLVKPEHQETDEEPFDYYLVPGPFNQRIQFSAHSLASPMLPSERVKVVGYPRFDGWWAYKHGPYIVGGKPVLLWLPTWGAASSIDRFADAIAALSDRYEIWIKPHHGTVTHEPERMERLKRFHLIDFTEDPCRSYAAASVVLADLASGAFTEPLFLGKPTVALSRQGEHTINMHLDFAVNDIQAPEHLAELIAFTQRLDWSSPAITADLFTSTHGHDGEVAAKAIMECA